MFGKLLKYEFSAIAKDLIPVYLLMIIAAIVTNLLFLANFNTPSAIAAAIFGAITVAAVVVTLVTTIRRFRRNLLKDEGYLMFTLPVSTKQLILSKALAAMIWAIIGLLCGLLSGIIIVINVATVDWKSLSEAISMILSWATAGDWLLLFEILIAMILNFALFLFAIYLSISVAQLPLFKANDTVRRKVVPFVCFILFYVIYVGICNLLGNIIPLDSTIEVTKAADLLLPVLAGIGIEFVVATGAFFLTDFILSKHLNLD